MAVVHTFNPVLGRQGQVGLSSEVYQGYVRTETRIQNKEKVFVFELPRLASDLLHTQVGLELLIIQPLTPECWNYKGRRHTQFVGSARD